MKREDIICLALEAGLFDDDQEPLPEYLEHFANLVVEEIANLVVKEMINDGWRQCAKGQRTTQFCGMAEKSREEEREECAKACDDQAEYADEHLTDSAWRSADRCAAAIRARKSK